MASLQFAQAVATTEQGHRAVEAVGTGGMNAALMGANTMVAGVSALQQRAAAAYGVLATLNPLRRDTSLHTDPQNMNNDEDSEESGVADDRFAVGSDCSDDDPLDGIQIEEANAWREEAGVEGIDNFS